MDSEFNDIKAYKDDDLPVILRRILSNEWFISNLRMMILPRAPGILNHLTNPSLKLYLKYKLRKVNTVKDFHERIIIRKILNGIIGKTTDGITYSGLEKLDPDKPYLFVSNHRDIALDPILLNFILLNNNHDPAEVGLGNNLVYNDILSDLFRIYGSFIISRDLPQREKIKAAYSGRSAENEQLMKDIYYKYSIKLDCVFNK